MNKRMIIIIIGVAVILGFYTYFIGWFFSNNRIVSPILLKIIIRSPIEPVIRVPVSDVTPTLNKNKRKASTGAVFAEDKLPTYPENSIQEKIVKAFPEEPAIMLAIAEGESGFRNDAESWTGCCYGVMQIHEFAHRFKIPAPYNETRESRITWLKDEDNNLKIARIIYDDSDKYPWEAYTDGSYLKHLNKYL